MKNTGKALGRKNNKYSAKVITTFALLIALEVVLNRFASINTPLLKIGFGFVPIVIAAVMYGPIASAVIYGLADLIGALLFPIGPYFPGFTLTCALMGAVYGLLLYKADEQIKEKKETVILKTVFASLVNHLVFGLLLNSYWLSIIISGRTYLLCLETRLPQELMYIPVNIIIIPLLIGLAGKLKQIQRG